MPESTKVVDSWALVAWVRDEPPASAVEVFIQEAEGGRLDLYMSWMNVAETFYIVAKRENRQAADRFMHRLPLLPIRLVLPDARGIMAAARIKATHPVAFGDAFAIALAQDEQASVITGDPEIRKCAVVPVDWIGE